MHSLGVILLEDSNTNVRKFHLANCIKPKVTLYPIEHLGTSDHSWVEKVWKMANVIRDFVYSGWKTPMLSLSLRLYQSTFGYLPHFSLQIGMDDFRVPTLISPTRSCGAVIVLGNCLFYCVMIAIALLKRLLFPETTHRLNDTLETIRIALALLSMACVIPCSLVPRYMLTLGGPVYSHAAGYIFSTNSSQLSNRPMYSDRLGMLLLYLVHINTFISVPFGIWSWCVDLDPCTFILDELANSEWRILTRIVSLVWLIIIFVIVSRDNCVVGIFLMYVAAACHSVLKDLNAYLISTAERSLIVSNEYCKLWLAIDILGKAVNQIIFAMCATLLIILTICAWVVVRAYGNVPQPVTFSLLVVFLGCIVFMNSGLKFGANLIGVSQDLITQNTNRLRRIGNNNARLYAYRWSSLQPLSFKCGSHFHFTNDARNIYMQVLSDNITTAILLVKV